MNLLMRSRTIYAIALPYPTVLESWKPNFWESNLKLMALPIMRRKRKDCFKGYKTFCHKEGKSDVVMLNSTVSKLLHEFHLESGRQDKNEEKLVIRTATRLIWSDITSLNIDRVWYLDTST